MATAIHQPALAVEPCYPGCPGWFIDSERHDVVRCDSCAAFPDDDAAAAHVLDRLLRTTSIREAARNLYGYESRAIRRARR